MAQITADKINLEGYTTINNAFTIDNEGNPTISNGEITLKGNNWSDSKLNIISESNNDKGSLSPLS